MLTRKVFDTVLKYIYPPCCPICKEILSDNTRKVCIKCAGRLHYIKEPVCFRCGKMIENEEQEYCEDCSKNRRSYIRGFPALVYDDSIKPCLMDFKYKGKKQYADFLASLIVREKGSKIIEISPDVFVPVPVHKSRKRERGYNQAELLSQKLTYYLGIPTDSGLLIREQKTMPQKCLDNVERERNLKKAFKSVAKSVEYNRVVLVDDIYTTGATIESCTRVLQDMGVSEVYYTSICIGKGY